MNLESNSEDQGFELFCPAFANLAEKQPKITEQGTQIHFSQDYVSLQDMTDGLRNQLCPNEAQLKSFCPEDDDDIDQFFSFEENNSNIKQVIHKRYSKIQVSPLIGSITPQVPEAYRNLDNSDEYSNKIAFLPQTAYSKISRSLSKDYNKNLAGYIAKKAIKILTSLSYRKSLEKYCRSKNVQVTVILEYCKSRLRSIFGLTSIIQFFSVTSEDERVLKQVLIAVFMRILRRDYTLKILRDGRMLDYEAYVKIKNFHLLYFSQILP